MSGLELKLRPFSEVTHVGVVITKTQIGFHSGFLYQLPGENPRILHLAFHHLLEDDLADDPFRWAEIGVDADNKMILAEQLARIARIKPLISYGFDSEGSCFDANTGDLLPLPIGKGLTCATFILAVLRTYKYVLLDASSWPDRPEDRQWEQTILDYLANRASDEHIDAVKKDVGARRFRPDEVVGAATLLDDLWPVSYESAREIADRVIKDLE